MKLLDEQGADVLDHDPQVKRFTEDGRLYESVDLTAKELARADAVVIVTDHAQVDYQLVADHASVVVDTRNVMAKVKPSKARIVLLAAPRAAMSPKAAPTSPVRVRGLESAAS
jgi:UDP-N-acetyl-D-glucosamine dehydrogenase